MMDDQLLTETSPEETQTAEPAETQASEQQQAETQAVQEVVLSSAQYDSLTVLVANGYKASVTSSFFCGVLLALLLGSVLYGHFVRGWRS